MFICFRTQRMGAQDEHPRRRGAGAGGRAAWYAARTAGAGSAGRRRAYRDDFKPARALLHALPSGAAGTAHHGRSCKTVRTPAQNGGSAGLPRQKDAGAADLAKRPRTL